MTLVQADKPATLLCSIFADIRHKNVIELSFDKFELFHLPGKIYNKINPNSIGKNADWRSQL
ncbi:MAG: hypothetical protein JWR09_1620 [Mucilaginibacter sp.]|nr:hypothetical protein [Mucilaginibacter sp.]